MRRVAGRVSLFKEIQLGNSTSNELRGIIWEGSDLYEGKKKQNTKLPSQKTTTDSVCYQVEPVCTHSNEFK